MQTRCVSVRLLAIVYLLFLGGVLLQVWNNPAAAVGASGRLMQAEEPACVEGDFTAAATSPETVGDRPLTVVIADFNNDGKPDLATGNREDNTVSILLGNGAGDFTQPATSPETAGDGPGSLAVVDFNNDGRLDLATANRDSNVVTVLNGDETGNFTPAATSPETAGTFPSCPTPPSLR